MKAKDLFFLLFVERCLLNILVNTYGVIRFSRWVNVFIVEM